MWDFLSNIGSGISSAVSSAGNWLKNLGGGSSTSAIPQDYNYTPSTPLATSPSEALSGVGFGTSPSVPSGGGGSDWLSSLGSLSKYISPALSLGQAGLGLYGGIKGMQQGAEQAKMQKEALQQQRAVTQAALGPGQQLTAAGTSALMGGKLPEGLEGQLEQWKQSQLAQIRNYLAKAGQTDSTTLRQWEAYIESQVPIQRAQLAQTLMQPGGNLLSAASSGAARQTGTLQASQQGLPNLIEGANKALTSLQALSTPKKPTEER